MDAEPDVYIREKKKKRKREKRVKREKGEKREKRETKSLHSISLRILNSEPTQCPSSRYNSGVVSAIKKIRHENNITTYIQMYKISSKEVGMLMSPLNKSFNNHSMKTFLGNDINMTSVIVLYQVNTATLMNLHKKRPMCNWNGDNIYNSIREILCDQLENGGLKDRHVCRSVFSDNTDRYFIHFRTISSGYIKVGLYTSKVEKGEQCEQCEQRIMEKEFIHINLSDSCDIIQNFILSRVANYIPSKIPLSHLFFSVTSGSTHSDTMKIIWGYTYKDALFEKYSSILTELLQLWMKDKKILLTSRPYMNSRIIYT